MNNYIIDANTRLGTITGTLLVFLLKADPTQILTTIIMAATAAFVSFVVSVFCKFAWKYISKKIDRHYSSKKQ